MASEAAPAAEALTEKAQQVIDQTKDLSAEERKQIVVELIAQFNLLEASELVSALEDKFGVSAQAMGAPMMMPGAAGAGAAAEEAEEEATEFDVILKDFGSQKVGVIKVVRAETGLGLKEAKDLVESAPTPVKEAVPKEDAEKCAEAIKEAGGQAEVKPHEG